MLVTARGLEFRVHTGGPDDGDPIVLLHGFPQHAGQWTKLQPALDAAGLRTFAIDQRGYSPGARPDTVDGYRMAECVADVLAIMSTLDIESAHVVGHDWGAAVGWQVAGRHPERVRTLTAVSVAHPLAAAYAFRHDPDQRERSAYFGLFRQPGRAEDVLLADDAKRLRALFAPLDEAEADRYVAPMREPAALTAGLNWYRAMSSADVAGLGAVAVPTTYVWSDGDAACGRTAAERCADYVTGDYRFVELSGVSHWIPDQAPDALAGAILDRALRG